MVGCRNRVLANVLTDTMPSWYGILMAAEIWAYIRATVDR
jgi:hypothetical protein